MGGFGATKFYSKYPDQFDVCIEYDGAMVTWPVMLQFHAQQAQAVFNNDEVYFNQHSPWHWTTAHAAILEGKPPIRMVVGSLVGGNQNFRNHLQSLGIPVEYVETACGHDLGCLLTAQGQQSASFIAKHLGCAAWGGAEADLNHDMAVDVDDLLLVIQNWNQTGPDIAGDVNGDETIDADDLLSVISAWGDCT
jgi:hypothetical protein